MRFLRRHAEGSTVASGRGLRHFALVGTALLIGAGSAWAQSGGTLTKVRVTDPQMAVLLEEGGARLVGDYGGFKVLVLGSGQVAPANQSAVEVRNDYNVLLLNAGKIDTTSDAAQALRQPVGSFSGKQLHLVQFAGPVQAAWLRALQKTGAQLVSYLPNNAYLVYGDSAALGALQTWGGAVGYVQWDAAYANSYKISPYASPVDSQGNPRSLPTDQFSIQMVDDAAANAATLQLIDGVKLAPILRQDRALGYRNVIVRLPSASLSQIAAQPDVVSIHLYITPTHLDERQDQIIAGSLTGNVPSGPGYLAWLAGLGFTQAQFDTSGFAVDVSDSGIDNGTTAPNHFGLYVDGLLPGTSRIIYNRLEGTPNNPGSTIQGCDGHGTLNTHIIAGFNDTAGFPHADASGFHYGLGVCPFVRVGSSVIFDPNVYTFPNFQDLQSQAYNDGARVSNNSWGAYVSGEYTVDSQEYDALVRDAQPAGSAFPQAGNQEMVIVFSNGNSGQAAETVGSPATAKNVISVGASENVQAFGGPDNCGEADSGANNANDMADFSSRGPCVDGRHKPDIVAPGTHVSGGVFQTATPGGFGTADPCFDGSGVCGGPGGGLFFPVGQEFFTTSTGTSHSAPAVVGGCALLRQYFINLGMTPPSPAMTKAYLINSARYLNGVGANDTLWSDSQGMGEMNLGLAFDGSARYLQDQATAAKFTATGQQQTYVGTIADPSKPFRVTVAWTDAPGSTSGDAFNNDLDLTVTIGGVTYRGNVFSGDHSVPGGVADPRNNVESVFLPAGTTGSFRVTVTAANINSDGVPGDGDPFDQDFALVVYNETGIGQFDVRVLDTFVISDGNSNGGVDPNECVQFGVVLTNYSSQAINGPVPVTVRSRTSGVTITQNSSSYPTIPGKGVVTNLVPYQMTTSHLLPCGMPIDLEASMKIPGQVISLPFNIFTGMAGALSTNIANNAALPIPDVSTVESTNLVDGINGPIAKIVVSLYLTHPYDDDLQLTLVGPDGTEVLLSGNNGGNGQDYGSNCVSEATVFDDAAAVSIGATNAPFVGTYIPQQPLAAFIGKSANGAWRLRVADTQVGDVGTLQCWTLDITADVCADGGGPCSPIPQFCYSADTLDFGGQQVGMPSFPMNLVITNCGTVNLVISNAVITGTDAADFVAVADGCSGQTLGADEGCAVQVVFTPSVAGIRFANLIVTNNATGTQVFGLTGSGITCPPLTMTPMSLPPAHPGVYYSQALSVLNATPPLTFFRTAGGFPDGIGLTGSGMLTGTPTVAGPFPFRVVMVDANGCTASRYYNGTVGSGLNVVCGSLTVSPVALPVGEIGQPYSATFTASGGAGPFTYAVTSGSLPEGMSLDAVTGSLSGTPLVIASAFDITATDTYGCRGARSYALTLAIGPPSLPSAPLPPAMASLTYTATLVASGGQPPYRYAITAGALPSGLALSDAGVISGVPNGNGSANFTVSVTDSGNRSSSSPYTLTVETVVRRPDASIRLKGINPVLGADIYSANGSNQMAKVTAAANSLHKFFIYIRNQGSAPDQFVVKGRGDSAYFTVRYYLGKSGASDITAAVVSGTYATDVLAPGAQTGGTTLIRMEVYARPSAPSGSSRKVLVSVSSSADPTAADSVKARVNVP